MFEKRSITNTVDADNDVNVKDDTGVIRMSRQLAKAVATKFIYLQKIIDQTCNRSTLCMISLLMTKPTFMRPAKSQISLHVRSV